MRVVGTAVVLSVLMIPSNAQAARSDRGFHERTMRSVAIDKPKRPLPPRKRKPVHVKGDFWDVFPIPGLIPALNLMMRG